MNDRSGAIAGRGGRNLDIPDRDYRLAPQRRESTIAFVRMHGRWFAAVVVPQARLTLRPPVELFCAFAGWPRSRWHTP